MLTYKRKLKLTNTQENRVISWIGACRVVYNLGLEIKIEAWRKRQLNVSVYDLMKQLPSIKDIDWIKDVPSQSLQDSLDRLDKAYKSFFKGGGFPRYKSKKSSKSILFKTATLTSNNSVKLPKIGKVKFFKDKSKIEGKIKNATIKIEPTGLFIYIVCDEVEKNISNPDESQVIGIDMGITHFLTDSNGVFVENPKHFKKYERQLRIENRSLARKEKGSVRWEKQSAKLSKLHHKISNVRKDYLHKVSTEYAKMYHTVYMEGLNIKGMSKNTHLSKHILDCGWGKFKDMLSYKTNVVKVNPRYTSQTCSACGDVDKKSRISQSEYACRSCGHVDNADVNAAKNIMSKGIALSRKRDSLECALAEEPHLP